MIPTAQEFVRAPFRYSDPSMPPGHFYALAHADSTCSFVQHETNVLSLIHI